MFALQPSVSHSQHTEGANGSQGRRFLVLNVSPRTIHIVILGCNRCIFSFFLCCIYTLFFCFVFIAGVRRPRREKYTKTNSHAKVRLASRLTMVPKELEARHWYVPASRSLFRRLIRRLPPERLKWDPALGRISVPFNFHLKQKQTKKRRNISMYMRQFNICCQRGNDMYIWAAANPQDAKDLIPQEQIALQAIRLAKLQSEGIKFLLNHYTAPIKSNACELASALVHSRPVHQRCSRWSTKGIIRFKEQQTFKCLTCRCTLLKTENLSLMNTVSSHNMTLLALMLCFFFQ